MKKSALIRPALPFDAHFAAGRPARNKAAGLVAAAMSGIRSIQEASAPSAYTNGLRPSASRAPAARRTPTGTRPDNRRLRNH